MHKKGAEALSRANEFPAPLFMAHGGEDKITSSEASKYFAERVLVESRFVLYKNSYHEIHNDTEKELFFTEVINWLDKH
jgi:alpha-beta hydrolase superfamily lysophospholipase